MGHVPEDAREEGAQVAVHDQDRSPTHHQMYEAPAVDPGLQGDGRGPGATGWASQEVLGGEDASGYGLVEAGPVVAWVQVEDGGWPCTARCGDPA